MRLLLLEEVCVFSLPSRVEEVLVKVTERRLPVDLIVLEMVDHAVILGMD